MIIGAPSPNAGGSDRIVQPARGAERQALALIGDAAPTSVAQWLRRNEPAVQLPTGPVSKLLTKNQKAYLSQLAKSAFIRAEAHHATDGLSSDEWRHAESIKAAGVRISEAEQRHYNAIKGHFELLSGQAGKAFGTHLRESTNDLRIAHFKLATELKIHGLAEEYAAAICRRKYRGLALSGATAKQVWAVTFDIRRSHTKSAKAKRDSKTAAPKAAPSTDGPF